MKRFRKILTFIFVSGAIFFTGVYTYLEPQSTLGGLYLKSQYNPEEQDLLNISTYLQKTNGGYIPRPFDDFLYNKLTNAEKGSSEYKNILGFYAHQSRFSRAGYRIFKEGNQFLPSIIEFGRASPYEERQHGFLFLAYGIAQKNQAYKPTFYSSSSIDKNFTYIENGSLESVGIESP